MNARFWHLAIPLALAFVAAPARAAAPDQAILQLRELGVAVALPSAVPPGFRLERVLTPKAWAGPAFGPTYVALYGGPGGRGFAIESAGSDLGSAAEMDSSFPAAEVKPRYFPKSRNIGLYWIGPRANAAKSWMSDWIEGPEQFYRLVGPGHVREQYHAGWGASAEIDKAWAVRVLDSIHVVGAKAVPRKANAVETPRPFLTDFDEDHQWRDIRTVPVR